jgi:hypothetical protein
MQSAFCDSKSIPTNDYLPKGQTIMEKQEGNLLGQLVQQLRYEHVYYFPDMNPSNFSSSLNWNTSSYFLAAKIFSTKEEVVEKHFGNFISKGDKWVAP